MMTDKDYLHQREWFRQLGVKAEKDGNIEKAEHFAGVVRGLDMAFGDGLYKSE